MAGPIFLDPPPISLRALLFRSTRCRRGGFGETRFENVPPVPAACGMVNTWSRTFPGRSFALLSLPTTAATLWSIAGNPRPLQIRLRYSKQKVRSGALLT